MKPASTGARGAAGRGGAPRRPVRGTANLRLEAEQAPPGSRAGPGDGGPHLRPPPAPPPSGPPAPPPSSLGSLHSPFFLPNSRMVIRRQGESAADFLTFLWFKCHV